MIHATLIGALCGLIVTALARPFLVGNQTAPAAEQTGTAYPAGGSGAPRTGRAHGGALVLRLAVAALASAAVAALLVDQLHVRAPGTTRAPASSTTRTTGPADAKVSSTGRAAGRAVVTPRQMAAVRSAMKAVRTKPGDPAAHVALAHAYAVAGQAQLATVEYLAAKRLDRGNPEANTALALVAFKAGNAQKAEALATDVLRDHPGYPEALYTRGLIRAMGLHHSAAATRDLTAYQRLAPFGSHRTTVATVLALLKSGAIK